MIVTLAIFVLTLWGPFSHEVLLGAEPLISKMAAKPRPSEWRAFVMHVDYGLPHEPKKMSKRERLVLALSRSTDAAK
jgi:hypothetical protein